MIRSFVIALTLAFVASAAGAQTAAQSTQQTEQPPRTYTQAELWNRSGDRITFALAQISFPAEIGAMRIDRISEASREGRGLDNAILFMSPDRQVFATIYVYAPALADVGLTAFMTDHAIRLQSDSGLRVTGGGIVAAGGREGVAIRTDYTGYRDARLASSAAFMRAGGWIIKLRVSGPGQRRAEVEQAMTALLRDLRFEGEVAPSPARAVATGNCARESGQAARRGPTDQAETMEDAIMGHRLGAEVEGRTGPLWCPSSHFRLPNMSGPTPVLRATADAGGEDSRRSVLVALIADNGTMIEVVQRRFRGRTRFVLMHHQIGRSVVLGSYDAVPTDEQIANILSGADREGGQARAVIDYQASGDSGVTVIAAPEPATPTT